MKIVNEPNYDNWTKFVVCPVLEDSSHTGCGAELEADVSDLRFSESVDHRYTTYVECPICGRNIMVDVEARMAKYIISKRRSNREGSDW